MEQLYVRKELFPLSEDGPTYLKATDAEVKAAAATLDGAEVVEVGKNGMTAFKIAYPGRFLVIPLSDKETTND